MPHNLAETGGRAAMMYVGEKPWHGLGTELAEPATAAEAIAAAGLDYEVRMEPIRTESGILVPMGQAAVRSDTNEVLGMVGRKWQPIQNRDCFAFLDGLVGEGGLRYHTAGALGRGERVWMLAKLPNDIRVNGSDDITEKYLLLSNAHDGFSSLRCLYTPIRVVCSNTLNAAERMGRDQGVTIRHTGNLAGKINEARRILGIAERFYVDFEEKANLLASRLPTVKQVQDYFEVVFPMPVNVEDQKRAAENARAHHQKLHELFISGMGQGMPGIKRSLWAAFNAVTEYVDHKALPGKGGIDDNRAARLASNWFGQGAALKGRAFEAAVAMAMN